MATNLEIVTAAVEAFRRGDIPGPLDMCSEEVDVTLRGDAAAIPFAGRWTGKTKVAEFFESSVKPRTCSRGIRDTMWPAEIAWLSLARWM
jgi:hypothetical protein